MIFSRQIELGRRRQSLRPVSGRTATQLEDVALKSVGGVIKLAARRSEAGMPR